MLFMELLRILQVYLEDIARSSLYLPCHELFFCRHNTHPSEVSNREGLTHSPAVEIVCIEIENVRCLFLWIVVMEIGIVCFAVALHLFGNAASHSLLNEEVHVVVGKELEFH